MFVGVNVGVFVGVTVGVDVGMAYSVISGAVLAPSLTVNDEICSG